MEIKINKEIQNYKESIFFGLSMRQFFFSIFGCGSAVLLYFLLRPYLSAEILSWICVLIVVPFAFMGFVTYNGMPAEKLVVAWFKSEILMPKYLIYESRNIYLEIFNPQKRMKKKPANKKSRLN